MIPREWYESAVFSNLAYVRWDMDNSTSLRDLSFAALDANRVPNSVMDEMFSENSGWTIPSFHPNDNSGFAANIIQNGEEAVLAIRGTEANLLEALPFVGETGWQDLLDADIADIGLTGFAMDQTVSLVNYVMQLQGAAGADVTQVMLRFKTLPAGIDPGVSQPFITVPGGIGGFTLSTYYWLEEIAPATGLGILDGDSNASVTGHSLGGHLAVMAIRLFPELFDQAVTFNAPGFDPLTSKELTDQFVNLFGEFLSIPVADSFADIEGRVTAIESESSEPGDDLSGVASLFTGIPVGQEVLIHTENNSHSMDQLMDALALHSLVSTLNPTLDVGQLLHFYDGASDQPGATEETLVTALARVILGEEPTLDLVEAGVISHGDFADRVQIHNQIVDIQNEVLSRGLVLEPIWDKTPEELASLAGDSIAYRYAILNLDPFAVLGDDSLYLEMSDGSPFISDAHSEAYWLARAEMLLAKFNLGLTDGALYDTGGLVAFYSDVSEGVEVTAMTSIVELPLYTIFAGEQGTGLQTITGSDEADSIFGGIGGDRLAGGEGSDIIDGGGGSDVLIAGESIASSDDGVVDWLEGGSGVDLFYVGNGDVISDSDRAVAGVVLSGWSVSVAYEWVSEGLFETVDGTRTLELVGDVALITLTTLTTPSTMTILDFNIPGTGFRDGDFGISLVLPDNVELPTSTLHIIGTEYSDNPWDGSDDAVSLTGTDGSEGIAGLEGNDFIQTRRGMDFVDAGPGNDVVLNVDANWESPDYGSDTFIGGPGNDSLTGNAGGDWLLGGDGDDFVQGGGGADLLSGGNGSEVIFGGADDDIIHGDAGNDIVDGDKGLIDLDAADWLREGGLGLGLGWIGIETIEPSENGATYGADEIWGGSGSDYLLGGAGDDRLYGEDGSDTLGGGPGEDALFGGSGADTLRGGYGDDLLEGGSERDFMFGDYGDDELDGGDGDDRLAGGPGEDVLTGGPGNDRYEYSPGDGWDRIREVEHNAGAGNSILFDAGDYSGFYQLLQSGADLVIQHMEDDAGIIVEGWFADPESVLDEIQFNDRIWNIADISALAAGQGTRWSDSFYGTEGDDWFAAGEGEDYGLGGDGNDVIFGADGADTLMGDVGNDALYGGDGPDFIDGGAGDDLLVAGGNSIIMQADALWGGEGSDTYLIDPGLAGRTFIVDTDALGDDHDVIHLAGNARIEDMVFRQISNNGVLTNHLAIEFAPVGGAPSAITIFNWFGGAGRGIDAIEFDDGTGLTVEDINAMLNTPTNGRDYLFGAGVSVILTGLAGDDQLHGKGENNYLQGGSGADQLYASGMENVLEGGSGSDRLEVSRGQSAGEEPGSPVDILLGGSGEDTLEASFVTGAENSLGVVLLDGGIGADSLFSHGGRSVIIAGGNGFDFISGELSGSDSIIMLNLGDRGDVISSSDGWGAASSELPPEGISHVVSFGGGISLDDISIRQDGSDLLILTGATEGLRFVDYFDVNGEPATWLDQIQIVNQTTSSFDSDSLSASENSPIILLDFNGILGEYLQEGVAPDAAWYVIDSNSAREAEYFVDEAIGGQVVYEYALMGGEAYANPGEQVVGALRSIVSASGPVAIQLLATEPVAGVEIGQLQAAEDELFRYRPPVNFMVDPITGEALQIALESDLPAWLAYDPLTRELTGSPSQHDIGTVLVSFIAVNRFGQAGTTSLDIITLNTNDAPFVTIPAGSVTATIGEAFQYAIPVGMFADADADDQLITTIAAPGGGALPDWMQFDPEYRVLSGTPPLTVVDDIAVMIIATDSLGTTASSILTITLEPGSSHEGEIISGTSGRDILVGSTGNDTISGGAGRDELHGGDGDDQLDGGVKDDKMFGGTGQDRLLGGNGSDLLAGEDGNDVLLGGQGRDRVFGGAGDDYLSGDQGNDRLVGGDGDDVLVADSGNDRLEGDNGNDTYAVGGGAGKVTIVDVGGDDTVVFEAASGGDARFSRQNDNLVVRITGEKTRVVVRDWFSDPDARLEGIVFNDGVTLLEQDVLQLVQLRSGNAAQGWSRADAPGVSAAMVELPSPLGMVAVLEGSESSFTQHWHA